MNYTLGDWSVASQYKDTITTSKALNLPDLDYDSDYSRVNSKESEAKIANTTSALIQSPETIRFAFTDVTNIYANTEVDPIFMAPSKRGVQVMSELAEIYTATSDKTGATVQLPCKGRIVLRFPSNGVVTADLVNDLLTRVIATAFNTGQVSAARVMELARGSLLPSGM